MELSLGGRKKFTEMTEKPPQPGAAQRRIDQLDAELKASRVTPCEGTPLKVWTIPEIKAKRPKFGGKSGWFYGLVRFKRKLYLAEIYLGTGAALMDGQKHDRKYLLKDASHIVADITRAAG